MRTIVAGANFFRLLYPGRLRLAPNVVYQVAFKDSVALVFLKRNMLSCSILDHSNRLVSVQKESRHFTFLEKPVNHRPRNTIAADFTSIFSKDAIHTFVFTKEFDYTAYSQKPFTEILIGIESDTDCTMSAPKDNCYVDVFNRFIHLYRAMTGDVRAQPIDAIDADEPIIFWSFAKYDFDVAPLVIPPKIGVAQKWNILIMEQQEIPHAQITL